MPPLIIRLSNRKLNSSNRNPSMGRRFGVVAQEIRRLADTVVEATEDKVLPEMSQFGGEVYQTSLSNEDEDTLKKALEHENVSAAADELVELE